jgi:alpha-L-arabinofuranosidase
LASYAPLFAHAEAWQWTPDLIWVDNLELVHTPNYYVQQLFSRHRGDWTLPTEISGQDQTQPIYASATRDGRTGEIILKVVNPGDAVVEVQIALSGEVQPHATEIVLTGSGLTQTNALGRPERIRPEEAAVTVTGNPFTRRFRPRSLTVLLVKTPGR